MFKNFEISDLFVALSLLCCVAVIGALLLPFAFETGSGEHVVFVTAVQKNNTPWDKNYIVWVKTDLASSQEEFYCIQHDQVALAEALAQAARDKRPVTLSYKSLFAGLTWGLFNDFKCVDDIVVGLDGK